MNSITYEKLKLIGRLELRLEEATDEKMREAIVRVMFDLRKQVHEDLGI